MRITVFTTSYPRSDEDYAGRFVADQVTRLRQRGHEINIVSPGVFNDFGLCYGEGGGLMGNVRRKPWLAPLLGLSMIRSLRKVARGGDLVHAHWLAGALVARFAGKPFVVTLHGSGSAGRFNDLALMQRMPAFVRWLLRPAKSVICVSEPLATAATAIGIEQVIVLRNGVDLASSERDEAAEPFALYVGRLAPEKGIRELAEATEGIPLVVCGDGPERPFLPPAQEIGLRPHSEVRALYLQAACLVLSSSSEGSPTVVIEAMASGCPVVATAVGDVPYLIENGVTGFVVPIGDAAGLRSGIEALLSDEALRTQFGIAARERIDRLCGWGNVLPQLEATYAAAIA